MTPEEQPLDPLSFSFAPYTGVWSVAEAAHLLRRSLFGPTFKQINDAVANGMDATVNALLSIPTFTEPITHSANETIAAYGTTWVNSVFTADPLYSQQEKQARRDSLGAWLLERINKEQFSLHEKMCLFWHNHFAAESSFDSRAAFDYFRLIQNRALGNFKQLVKEMTINPNMLMFLNGSKNDKFSPNENYARELLELFTIGKGEQLAVGDYTNYTEYDISESSRILTGWRLNGLLSTTLAACTAVYDPAFHDSGTKTLSTKFGGAVIVNGDADEYATYVDVIFQQAETARYICRKIYRWFVNHDLSTDVEANIISEMSNLLISSNYEILPVLEALLKSEHFYDVSFRGSILKNPLELTFSMYNATEARPNPDINISNRTYLSLYIMNTKLGMNYMQAPSVAGWTAYYHAPFYYKNWVNSAYIKLRFDLSSYVTLLGGVDVDGNKFPINHLQFLDNLSNPSDSAQVVEDMVTVFCPKGLPAATKTSLQTVLLNGLPDFEWTIEYDYYISNPGDLTQKEAIKQRVGLALDYLFKLPEFQTI